MKIDSNSSFNQFQVNQTNMRRYESNFKELLADKSQINQESNQEDKKLKKVSQQFESIFINMMFKQMRKAGFKSDLLDSGMNKEIFEDMYYNEIAKEASKRNELGIAKAVYRQLDQRRK